MLNIWICFSTKNDLTSRSFYQLHDTIQMKLVDHFALLCTAVGTFAKQALSALNHSCNKIIKNGLVNKQVIRTNAGLATVQELRTTQLFYSVINVSCLVHNSWTLAA